MTGSSEAETGGDRISKLPEDVIIEILNRLPTKDAVATSILSKVWKYKWTFINHFICDTTLRLEDMQQASFAYSVQRTLLGLVQNATRIKIKLESKLRRGGPIAWIIAVSRHSVEELELDIHHVNFVLSSSLFNLTVLRSLVLRVPSFAVSSKNSFPHLTSLRLWRVKVMSQNDATDGTLTFVFPVLERMELEDCKWLNVKFVEIDAPAANIVSIMCSSFEERDQYTISIHSSRVAEFRTGANLQENILLNGSAVVRAALDNFFVCKDELRRKIGIKAQNLLAQISSTMKYLRLSMSFAQAIMESKHGFSYPPLRFDTLESLYVYSCKHFDPRETEVLFELLHAAPSLKVLSVDLAEWADFKSNVNVIESLPSCIASSLEEVRLRKYKDGQRNHGLVKLFQQAGVRIKRFYIGDESDDETI